MTEPQTPKSKPGPGWYPDPKMTNTKRYWDGESWTENRVPATPVGTASSPTPVAGSQGARIATATLIVLGAVGLWFGLAPDNSYEEARASIEAADDANNATTEGAPQQEVVNGWTTIEYLNLLSAQQEDSDNRRDALFVLALVAGAVTIAIPRSGSSKA